MQLVLKMSNRLANSAVPDQSDLGLHCLHYYHFITNFGVRNFRTSAVLYKVFGHFNPCYAE